MIGFKNPASAGFFIAFLTCLSHFLFITFQNPLSVMVNPLRPDPQSLVRHALSLHQDGMLSEAVSIYSQIHNQYPKLIDVLFYFGTAECQLGLFDSGEKHLAKFIKHKPDHGDAFNNRGNALVELGRFEDALLSLNRAAKLKPLDPSTFYNRGRALKSLGRLKEALEDFNHAIELSPDFAEAYCNRGVVLQDLKSFDHALRDYLKAQELNPVLAMAVFNQADLYEELGELEKAIDFYTRAITLRTDYVDAWVNKGNLEKNLGRLEEAEASYASAQNIDSELSELVKWNQSLLALLGGRYQEGWKLYEARWTGGNQIIKPGYRKSPLWLGDIPISGKSLFVYVEQGLGDTLQFCRYIPMLIKMGAKINFEVQEPLKELLGTLCDGLVISVQGDKVPRTDFQAPLLSLPLAFGTELDSIPCDIPYLYADPEKAENWKQSLGQPNGLRVGLVWSGGFRHNRPDLWAVNERRNIQLEMLASLNIPGIEFYSLQKGKEAEAQRHTLESAGWEGPPITDHTDAFLDFSDTAAFIECLDLVISVDTSTAHLAAAMGKSTWILNRFDTCWRWLLERETSPWYPTVRLFRQPSYGDWASAVSDLKVALEELVQQQG